MPHALLAELTMHIGDHAAAVEHALAALPVMQRIGASDDELQLRTLLVFCAIGEGRLADAADELGRVDQIASSATAFGWPPSGRWAGPNWRSPPATSAPGWSCTGSPRPGCARSSCPESPAPGWNRGCCSVRRWR